MARKAPRKPTHYNKKSNNRTKPQSSVSLRDVFDELRANGYEVVQSQSAKKNRKAASLVAAWFYKEYPRADYSNSGRTVRMCAIHGRGEYAVETIINLPVSDGQLSRDAVKRLRAKTGLDFNPQAEAEENDASVPRVGEEEAAQARFDQAVMDVYELYAAKGEEGVSDKAIAKYEEQVEERLSAFTRKEQKAIKEAAQELLLKTFGTAEALGPEDDDDGFWDDDDEVYIIVDKSAPRP